MGLSKSAFGADGAKPAIEANPVLVTQPAPVPIFPIADPRLARLVSTWETLTPEKRQEVLRAADPYRMPCAPFPDPIAVLRRVEWLGIAGGWASCPLCGRAQTIDHALDCDLAAVLRAHPPTTLAPPAARG